MRATSRPPRQPQLQPPPPSPQQQPQRGQAANHAARPTRATKSFFQFRRPTMAARAAGPSRAPQSGRAGRLEWQIKRATGAQVSCRDLAAQVPLCAPLAPGLLSARPAGPAKWAARAPMNGAGQPERVGIAGLALMIAINWSRPANYQASRHLGAGWRRAYRAREAPLKSVKLACF